MNKSKKAVAIVVAALCMGLMVTGCGKQEGSLQESASQMSSEPESSHKSIQEELQNSMVFLHRQSRIFMMPVPQWVW